MKKLIMVLTALCLMAMPSMADTSKQLRKALNKQKSEKLKEFKNDRWKVFGTGRTLEVALLQHYDKLADLGDNAREIAGVATKCVSKNIGAQMAFNNACITYAQSAGSQLSGRVVSDMSGDAINTDAEFEHFYAAYERMVEKEIRGELQESFSIIRENGDGTYEIQSFFVVDEDKASTARLRALDSAMKESEAARRNAERISSFVKEKVR